MSRTDLSTVPPVDCLFLAGMFVGGLAASEPPRAIGSRLSLELVAFRGSKQNNLVQAGRECFLDRHEQDPARRFKRPGQHLADGIKWTPIPDIVGPRDKPWWGSVLFVEHLNKYILCSQAGFPRQAWIRLSDDLKNWSSGMSAVQRDENDPLNMD